MSRWHSITLTCLVFLVLVGCSNSTGPTAMVSSKPRVIPFINTLSIVQKALKINLSGHMSKGKEGP